MSDLHTPGILNQVVDDSSEVAARAWREKRLQWLDTVIGQHCRDAEQLQVITIFCTNLQAWEQLQRTCDLILELNPLSAGAHRLKATAILEQSGGRNTHAAIVELEAALKLAPTHVAALADLAGLHIRLRNPKAALPLLEEAIRQQPLIAGLHFNLSLALAQLKRFDEGIAAVRFAIQLDPANVRYYTHLGALLGELRRFEEGIDACLRALTVAPANHPAMHNLGEYQFTLGRYADAEATLRRALALDAHPQTLFFLGATLARLDRREEADQFAARLAVCDANQARELRSFMAGREAKLPEREPVS